MKLQAEIACREPDGMRVLPPVERVRCTHERAFTLMEVMVALILVLFLIVGGIHTILFVNFSSHRLADTTSALGIVQAKIEEIRAASYNPPNYPFTSTNVYITNQASISLDKAGTNYLVPGTLISQITPSGSGHLVTVTATFNNADQVLNPNFSVSLQTVVNQFSAGQQQ